VRRFHGLWEKIKNGVASETRRGCEVFYRKKKSVKTKQDKFRKFITTITSIIFLTFLFLLILLPFNIIHTEKKHYYRHRQYYYSYYHQFFFLISNFFDIQGDSNKQNPECLLEILFHPKPE
jgi:hypothetical protein